MGPEENKEGWEIFQNLIYARFEQKGDKCSSLALAVFQQVYEITHMNLPGSLPVHIEGGPQLMRVMLSRAISPR